MAHQSSRQRSTTTNHNQFAAETNKNRQQYSAQNKSLTIQQVNVHNDPNIELECSHCLLPVDTLDKPCPFCGHQPSGRDYLIPSNDFLTYEDAPWGIRAIAAINQASAVFSWFVAGCLLIPFLAYGEIGALVMATVGATTGYLNWRLGIDLLKKQKWARTLQTIFAVFSLFVFPLGTLWGALALWGLHSSKAEEYFENKTLLPEKTD
jgi:hypothetical protein